MRVKQFLAGVLIGCLVMQSMPVGIVTAAESVYNEASTDKQDDFLVLESIADDEELSDETEIVTSEENQSTEDEMSQENTQEESIISEEFYEETETELIEKITEEITEEETTDEETTQEETIAVLEDSNITVEITTKRPKAGDKIELEITGADESTELFGFGKNKHWVLLANYLDESLMRNTVAYRLSAKLGIVDMETTWVDVVLNGSFVGNYQLCEHIRIADSRVNIFNW